MLDKKKDEVIDWDEIAKQPPWFRNRIIKGKIEPPKKKKDAEKKQRNKSV